MSFEAFIKEHIWVPIVAGVVLLIIVVLIIYFICAKCRNYRRYDYTALRDDLSLPQKIRFEKIQQENTLRDEAWMSCQFYMRSNPQYDSVQRMENIGSRFGRHWFRVKDSMSKENVMTITQVSPDILVPFTSSTRKTLKELFLILKHPYIFPTRDIDFVIDQRLVVVVQPISNRGSLKDFIYQTRFAGGYQEKYCYKSKGLINSQIRLFGRQILEALLFLEKKGFPLHGHLMSSNVMVSDGSCRLAAIENSFLGYTSKLHPIIHKKISKNKQAVDVVCFGHLFYEMCTGQELQTAHPTPVALDECKSPDTVNVLNFIFENENGKFPTIREISELDFFCHEKLLELAKYNPTPIHFSSSMKSIIKSVKKGRQLRKMSTRRTSSHDQSTDSKIYTSTTSLTDSVAPPTPAPTPAPSIAPPPPPPIAPPPPVAPPPPIAPPPPVGAPPPVSIPAASTERSALLGDIRKGTRLKKTETNDRSAPNV